MKKFFHDNQFIILALFLFCGLVLLFSQFSPLAIPQTGDFLFFGYRPRDPGWLWSRANFDGYHYLEIAQKGYGLYQQAFFPLYPFLIGRFGLLLSGRFLLAGFLVSFFAFFASLLIFERLVRMDFSEKIARRSLIYLLVFPTAFFFLSIYTESLFFLFVLASFYFTRRRQYLPALAGIALASATRLVGVFLIPALIYEVWRQEKPPLKRIFLSLSLALSGLSSLAAYMFYLWQKFADPLLFIHVQPSFGAQRSVSRLILIYQVFWRYLKMIATCQYQSPLYFTVWLEFLTGLGFLLLLIPVFSKLRKSYFIFALPVYLLPTLTGTFSSLPRYVLTLFPCFIALALLAEKNRFLKSIYFPLAILFSIISQFFFARGYWVS